MKKVLIIEDDMIDQMSFVRMFEKQKLECTFSIASSVNDAKEKLNLNKYDLVISDHNLADGTTFDLLNELKNIPLILITGNEDKNIINSVISQTGAVACFTKDLNFKYLEELPKIIHLVFNQELTELPTKPPLPEQKSIPNKSTTSVKIDIRNAYKIFDGKKEDIKETLEIFMEHKPKEMDDLYQRLQMQDCKNAVKVAHRMKSGFRILGMKQQEELAELIENSVLEDTKNCESQKVLDAFKKLSSDTKIAIDLLRVELARL